MGLVVERADDIEHSESILDVIWARIGAADALIADTTGSNPNVLYEIGLAHAVKCPTILIARKGSELPFDLQGMKHVLYETIVELRERLKERLKYMFHRHALPENWEHLEYGDFLEQRRELMAQVIAEGYRTLAAEPEAKPIASELDISCLISIGESEAVEFKATLRMNRHTGNKDPRMEHAILRTLAGFLNTGGGTLIVGVADDGSPIGIDVDDFQTEDKMNLHLVNIVKSRMGPLAVIAMHAHFEDYKDSRVMVVRCDNGVAPVFVKDGAIERFYIRTGPSTTELSATQTHEYIKQRYKG